MLKLEKLEVSGFKSFVDPVTVRFAGGITAIVGPNGCGKSNLSDAMSWVLGEQSAKTLRGGKMEDIIFNGSDVRRPLGMAEVTLSLKTPPNFQGAQEDNRIVLGRRVFRTGESQYRLNGRLVRLKEIKDLLMDTGLGIRAYSVIEQGKIGMILSGKPQERRRLIEEAAGITRYKARKRVAEVKLEEALANMLRLDDVISEIERALRSLKRQASAAKRFQEKQAEYHELLQRVLTGRWARLQERLRELQIQLEDATGYDAELAAALHRDEASLAAGREALDRQSRVLAECHQRRSDLAATIQGRQEFLKSSRQTLQEIAERLSGGRGLTERRQAEAEAHRRSLADLGERRQELLAERDQAAAAVEQDQHQIRSAENDLKQSEVRVNSVRQELLAAVAELTSLRGKLHQGQLEQERTNYRRQHLQEELDQLAYELEQSGEAMAVSRDRVAELETGIAERAEQRESVSAALEDTLDREAEATEERQKVQDQLVSCRQRRSVLEQLNQAQAERRAALEKALAGAGFDQPEYLHRRLEALAGWEQSLDFYLGELTNAVLLEGEEAGLTLARSLAGRTAATLLRPVTPDPERGPEVDDPAIVLSLGQALGLPDELAQALPPAFLVDDPADAERLARRHPGCHFLSRAGLWAEGGLLHVEGSSQIPGVLARERELANLAELQPKLEDQRQQLTRQIDELIQLRAQHASRKNSLEQELAKLRQDLAVAQARQQDLAGRYQRLETNRNKVAEDKEGIDAELNRLATRRQGLETELNRADERHRSTEEALERAQHEVEAAKEHRESLRTASAGRRGRLDVLQERLDSVETEVQRLETALNDAERQVQLWRQESDKLDQRRVDLEQRRQEAETELQSALEQQESADDQVVLEQEKVDDLRADISTLEERIQACRGHRDETRNKLEQLRINQASLHQDGEYLATSFRDEFHQELADIALTEGQVPRDLPRLEAELATTKETLERLGPVNVLAVDEYEEQEQRFKFLTAQRADVADSVTSLKATIKEINEESSERFRETFQQVNATFGQVFQRLFRGGEAEMHLLDEDDPLESGLEIVARPPGKRPQNIMLLSGGEKALTAIALLFALFRSKPSPFCILDEVDAPLDDSNTLRFVELLREMCADTQFLVITHNKITMEVAGTLYGVTMEERGVSKLVSVEMEDVQPQPMMLEATA